MPYPSNHRAGPFCSREHPALLILPLSNGHLMVSQVNRSNAHTLPTLNRWYPQFIDALALLQKGNLDYVAGRGVVALHRDWGEPWHEHQPRFFQQPKDMIQYAKAQKISRLFWRSLASEETENSQPPESTSCKGWKELWLTR